MTAWRWMVILALPLLAAGARALTIDEVVELSRAGVADDVILAQIEADGSRYVLTTAVIRRLKEQGVSDRVVEAMIRTRTTTATGERASRRYSAGSNTEIIIDGGYLGSTVTGSSPLVVVPTLPYYYGTPYTPPVTMHVGPNPPPFVNLPQGTYYLTPGYGYPSYHGGYRRPHPRPYYDPPAVRPPSQPTRPQHNTTIVPYDRREKGR